MTARTSEASQQTQQQTQNEASANTLRIIGVLTDTRPNREEIIERSRSTPLEYTNLIGDGRARVGWTMGISKTGIAGAIRAEASVSIICDSSPVIIDQAVESCKNMVNAQLADEVQSLQDLLHALNNENG